MEQAFWDQNVSDVRFVAFDTETTGVAKTDELVEIAAAAFDEEFEQRSFETLVRPEQPIPFFATRIHGITDGMVAGAPAAAEAIARFLEFLEWAGHPRLLIAHNAGFDIGFVNRGARGSDAAAGAATLPSIVLDSCMLAKSMLPELPSHGLEALAVHFGIDTGRLHRAMQDVNVLRQVFLRLLGLAADRAAGPAGLTLGALVELCGGYFLLDPADAQARARPFRLSARIAALEELCGSETRVPIAYESERKAGDVVDDGEADAWRTITPMAVKVRGFKVYLEAFCHRDGIKKTFRADRIRRIGRIEPSC